MIREAKPWRRAMHEWRHTALHHVQRSVFLSWLAVMPTTFCKHHGFHEVVYVSNISRVALKLHAWSMWMLSRMQIGIKELLARDKDAFQCEMIAEAEAAADRGSLRGTFAVVKRLSGYRPRTIKSIKSESGELAASEQEREEIWERHFA
eukprot:10842611-Karenia_brevis.AAC.1